MTHATWRNEALPLPTGPLLERLVLRIRAELGLGYPPARHGELAQQLAQAAHELGGERAAQWLAELAAHRWNSAQVQQLARYLTVGETYFLRDPACFTALRDTVLRPLVESRRGRRQPQLRMWSAACCTGEEAYGLLFMVDELLGDERDDWRLELLASDLNPDFLARARRGVYGGYAFRQACPAWRARHFVEEDGLWRVAPPWRDRIRFFNLNLSRPDYPDARRGLAELDVILCRNVLMYFAPEQAGLVLERLLACLAPDGVLLLSAVEAGIALDAGWVGTWLGDGYALRRPVAAAALSEGASARMPPGVRHRDPPAPLSPLAGPAEERTPGTEAERAMAAGRYAEAAWLLEHRFTCDDLSAHERMETCLLLVHACINGGRLEQAEQWLAHARALDRLDPRPYWLLSLLRYQQGRQDEALAGLQRVRYLEPDFVLAPFLELQIRLRQGEGERAERARQCCLALLAGHADDALVAEGDGLSVQQLRLQCLALGRQPMENRS
ncbi:CheR family methyltransferase [Pseudogulbenkiania subflava]|uniref:Chemotaxis protein methyltransferase CheR n=1 Tax=Pseudogulbenkiania subflava DSM 22618 TaxID=1123014 RepID=A0A1Y6BWZ6_9NEIS|nr:CheR family methyltransferase [Pseudogulbenkiania subflava]SMF31685.1 chemotaxis protein methyltransferase CheR [Pseudogulbenkiania subflava DSM 22618]